MGAGDYSPAQFSERCNLYSSGLSVEPLIIPDHSSLNGLHQELLCRSHCIDHNLENLLSLWKEVFNA